MQGDAEKMYKMIKSTPMKQYCGPSLIRCGLCGGTANSFKILSDDPEIDEGRSNFDGGLDLREKECEAALVFFRTRYAALIASQAVQSPDPMLWITEPAPEPDDVFWSNLCVPYRLLWIRRISTLMASIVFMLLFLGPTTFVQGLTHLEKLENTFPFLKGILKRRLVSLITGYLPSVVLMLFLYIVPPLMLLFATLEGSISRSSRKKSACIKVLYFMIWNVFFANILSGSYMDRLGAFTTSSPKKLAGILAAAVPRQAYFFMTYIMTSGWASLSFELMQPFVLFCNWFYRYILRKKDGADPYTFPYHTEVPRVLLLGLLGFTFSVLAPLILPFLLVYFFLAYLVYRNQILNAYITRYQTGGLYWPIVHNVVIFSLVLTQVIAATIFGMKRSSVASSFIFPLIICTLLFNMYCRQKFLPLFKNNAAQVLVEMDREDERSGKMEEIHQQLRSAYCQFRSNTKSAAVMLEQCEKYDDERLPDPEDKKPVKNKECARGQPSSNSPLEIREINQTLPVNFAVKHNERIHGPVAEHSHWEIHEKNRSLPSDFALMINEQANGAVAEQSRLEIHEKNRSVPANFSQMINELARGPAAEQPRLGFPEKRFNMK